jgi:hypothetical protein
MNWRAMIAYIRRAAGWAWGVDREARAYLRSSRMYEQMREECEQRGFLAIERRGWRFRVRRIEGVTIRGVLALIEADDRRVRRTLELHRVRSEAAKRGHVTRRLRRERLEMAPVARPEREDGSRQGVTKENAT